MALSLTIGSAPITKVQSGTVQFFPLPAGSITVTLPAPSSPGTTLVAVLGEGSTGGLGTISAAPTGWQLLISPPVTGTVTHIEIWAYVGNPGNLSSFTFMTGSVTPIGWWGQISEWSNVTLVAALEASGGLHATSGTTLAPTTTTNVLTVGDLAISAWIQSVSVPGAVTFTTPANWTRLADNGSDASNQFHLDAEYLINPATGATLGPTLTSSGTTISADGAIVVLKQASPPADQSAYLAYGSVTLRLNTLDFGLIDCPTAITPNMIVTLSDPGNYPDWTGTITQVRARDMVDLKTGHSMQVCIATNTNLPNFTSAPYKITDTPAAISDDIWLLENGDMWQLENGSSDWLMESSTEEVGYSGLSITSQVGSIGPPISQVLVALGELTLYAPAVWPGMTFTLVSSNLNAFIKAPNAQYTIQTIAITYIGANPPQPKYTIQFGDRMQTLAEWTKAHGT